MSSGYSSPSTADELVLHVWPGRWDLPSINPECLAAILYAQIVLPGGFVVEECTNPDLSPNGHLPYISSGLTAISTYGSISKHLSKLGGSRNPSNHLDALQSAQETAWLAFAQTHLGDLVACSLYTLKDNYWEYVRPTLADMFPVPQKYYIPDRMRNLHKSRLESIGLWNVAAEEREAEKNPNPNARSRLNETASSAFGKEKVLERARTHLDILANLLHDKPYFFGNEPSSLDAVVAAHILLLTIPPLPNDLLRAFITSNFPTLCSHAKRLRSLIQNEDSLSTSRSFELSTPYASEFDLQNASSRPQSRPFVPLTIRSAPHTSLSAFTSIFSSWRDSSAGEKEEKTDEEKQYDRLRWGWYALAVASVFAWGALSGLRIVVAKPDDDDLRKRRENKKVDEGEEEVEEEEAEVVEIEVEEDADEDDDEE
ncbi:hypothetical protein SCHPADRAFT_908202 [Schizopora paradoxa]|uniref:GST C-terminal domain-containing protein n=1 Tax=Schizopora paradoxa TaxID=27342 RepID=A0A0H2RBY4_9AGAM|nr:hypothetical protein SCHPADRAFT_908202 [Schizopora paradoxa]